MGARVHLLKFDRFFCSAFGAKPTNKLIVALREHYHACVNEKVEKVLAKYDYFHYYWEPKIIINYCCTHMSRQIHRSMHETLPRQSMEILPTITPLMCLPL